jgi:hypothetical protein
MNTTNLTKHGQITNGIRNLQNVNPTVGLNELYYYWHNWKPLPEWSKFFISLGSAIANTQNNNSRLIVALALPSRAYAACFIATSIVVNKALTAPNNLAVKEYFAKICSLPIGTTLIYRNPHDKRKYTAKFDGCDEVFGEQRIRVKYNQRYNSAFLVKAEDVLTISISDEIREQLPQYQRGYSFATNNIFLNKVFKKVSRSFEASLFTSIPVLDCVILGSKHLLKAEIEETRIALLEKEQHSPSVKEYEGRFQDILRVRSFQADGAAYRCEVLANSGNEIKGLKSGEVPPIAVFDGATSYLKWRDFWDKSDSVILLDRTETRFDEAIIQLNQDFSTNRIDEEWEAVFSHIPAGIEIMAYFEEKMQ